MSAPAGSATPRSRSIVDFLVASCIDQWPIVAFLSLVLVAAGVWSFSNTRWRAK